MAGAAEQELMAEPVNHHKMLAWAASVREIVAKPPGSDEGFSAESIARYAQSDFFSFSTWAIVCEEVRDTQFPYVYFERAHEELRRRGLSDDDIAEMRYFAWLTTGWLNYECMLWDWVNLDENDIVRAIEWQYRDGWISAEARDNRLAYVRQYA